MFVECCGSGRCVVVTPALAERVRPGLGRSLEPDVRVALDGVMRRLVCRRCGAHEAALHSGLPAERLCEDCDRPIAAERLRASPTCVRCMQCESAGGADVEVGCDPPAHFGLLDDDPDEAARERSGGVEPRCPFCRRRIAPGDVLAMAARGSIVACPDAPDCALDAED